MTFAIPRLYAIIDPAQTSLSPVDVSDILIEAGVKLIQYRDKHGSSRQVFEASSRVARRVQAAGGIFIVNDRPDIALAARADGVHVGQEDLPVEWARRVLKMGCQPDEQTTWLVGCSAHNLSQVVEADRTSADYVAFGPIFPTQSKEQPDPVVGLSGLREARKATRKALVAIGGIKLDSARSVLEAGADSVAVIGDLLKAPDIGAQARQFLEALKEQGAGTRS